MTQIKADTSAARLSKNIGWNFLGIATPLLAAIWCIPKLIILMGVERFGILSLIWMAIGYFSIFDLGIGRALTKLVSERLGKGAESEATGSITQIVKVGLSAMVVIGLILTVLTILFADLLVTNVLNISDELHSESKYSLYLLALCMPFVIQSAGQIGVLQAYQAFKFISIVRIPLGIVNYLGIWIAATFSNSLVTATIVLVVSRVLAWFAFRLRLNSVVSLQTSPKSFDWQTLKAIFSFGGWASISNVLSPFLAFCDRFMIGAFITASAVAYYTVPYDLVYRILIVPEAIAGVLFPAITMAIAASDTKLRQLYLSSNNMLLILMFLPLSIIILFAYDILQLWIGAEFAAESYVVMQLLAVGIFINAMARMPFVLLQGQGRPDLIAKLQMIELPIYLVMLSWLIQNYGIKGAAIAWVGRAFVDTICIFLLAANYNQPLKSSQYVLIAKIIIFMTSLFLVMYNRNLIISAVLAVFVMIFGTYYFLKEYKRFQLGRH